jgi:dihydropteroate synthase
MPFRLMGVVNVTPDSFSDGGLFLDPGAAVAHGLRLAQEGAEILDVGGESTRPGAEPVAAEEELRRVLPVVEGLAAGSGRGSVAISIDTAKASVARAALDAGARIVNDVTALRGDPEMAAVVAQSGAQCCLMHMLGEPRTMQTVEGGPQYKDVVSEVKAFLEERLAFAVAEGVAEERILLDPGIGFGKTLEHNLQLLRRLHELTTLGRPLVVGTSRKSFIGRILADTAPVGSPRERDPGAVSGEAREEAGAREPVAVTGRLPGTIATCVLAYERGAAVLRVHEVAPVRAALAVAAAMLSSP